MPFYLRDAHMLIASGFHRWPLDYPPAAVVTFLPGLLWGSLGVSAGIVAAAVALWLVLYRESREVGATWTVLACTGGLLFLGTHYDIYPALASTLGILAATRRRWSAAWLWITVATALKFYAAALWPLLLLAELRATGRLRWDRLAASVAGVAATLAIAALTAGVPNAVAIVGMRLRQSINIASLTAPFALLLPGSHIAMYTMARSVVGPYATVLGDVLALGFAVALVVLCRRFLRGQAGLLPTAAALLTWLVVLFKGLQAYYILWLFPFWALTGDRRALRWGYAAGILTTLRVVGVAASTQTHLRPYFAAALAANLCLLGTAWALSQTTRRSVGGAPPGGKVGAAEST